MGFGHSCFHVLCSLSYFCINFPVYSGVCNSGMLPGHRRCCRADFSFQAGSLVLSILLAKITKLDDNGKVFYRQCDNYKTKDLKDNKGNFNAKMSFRSFFCSCRTVCRKLCHIAHLVHCRQASLLLLQTVGWLFYLFPVFSLLLVLVLRALGLVNFTVLEFEFKVKPKWLISKELCSFCGRVFTNSFELRV